MTPPLRLLAVSHSCIVEVNRRLYAQLDLEPDIEVELVIPNRWPVNERLFHYRPDGASLKVHPLPVVLPGQMTLHWYAGLPRAKRPDIVLVDEQPWSLTALQFGWLARVWGARFAFINAQNLVKKYQPPFRQIERFSYRRAVLGLGTNIGAGEMLRQKGFRGRIEWLPHPVDLSLFEPGCEPQLRRQLGLSGVVFGYFGRLVPEKGVGYLVQALALACQTKGARVYGLIVGTGPELGRLKSAAHEAGIEDRVRFLEAVPHAEVGRFMRCMDVLVLPSRTTAQWTEQFGRVLVEALACGKAVIGSDSGNIPLLIQQTKGGLVFPEGDVQALAGAISMLAVDEGQRLAYALEGGRNARQMFNLERIASQLGQLLREVAR